ncbi:hypothetical protein F4809DRAFT_570532 [Biscogniauxia mediterranea]|nr:hypothetical protein F4809DRAFT_570532 [Biscogniauxia mediterranea]
MAVSSVTISTSTYETVQKWIGRQLESNAAVTDTQRDLLLNLEHTINPPPPPRAEPELDGINWIGLLQEYRAARLRIPVGVSGINFTESAVNPFSATTSNWLSQVTIDEHPLPFPGPSGGLFEDGTQPSFARKKDARKYAAKCAIEWLRANGYMPQTGGVKFPKVQQPQPAQQSTQKPTQRPTSQSSPPREKVATSPKANSATKTPTPASPFDDTQPSAVIEVERLCRELGIMAPKYKIEQDPVTGGFFSGYPDFGIHAGMVPVGIGRVENILSKKAAKEKIAEELLAPLQQIYDERRESDRKFMEGPASVKPRSRPTPA